MNKKQEKSAESKLIVSRCIITQISGWVKFTVCIHYPLYWWQCNVAFEHVHGLTETPKHHAGHEKDHQEILHCWGVTLLKGVTLSAPTPGLASLIIKSNHSRGVSPQMGESTFPPSLPPSFHHPRCCLLPFLCLGSIKPHKNVLVPVGGIQGENSLIILTTVFAALSSL